MNLKCGDIYIQHLPRTSFCFSCTSACVGGIALTAVRICFKEMTAWSLRSSWKYPLCLIKIFSDSSRYLVSVKEVLKGETATGGLAPFQGYGA
jgi:hypothetical protein